MSDHIAEMDQQNSPTTMTRGPGRSKRPAPAPKRFQPEHAMALERVLRQHFDDDEVADDFLRTMAGIELVMPPAHWVEERLRDRRIHVALKKDPSTAAVRRLADAHGVPLRVIAKSFARSNGGVGLKQVRQAGSEALVSHEPS